MESTFHELSPTPFQVICPGCAADSDAPDTAFYIGAAAPVPGTAFLLGQFTCEGCGTGFDRILWPVDPTDLSGSSQSDELALEAAGLLARYEALEMGYRQEWETVAAVVSDESFGTRGIDLKECPVLPLLHRRTAADPRLLAAARAARACAVKRPACDPAGMLWAGAFKCCVTLDLERDVPERRFLHVSISHVLGLGLPSRLEATFLISLYFAPDELSRLHCREGTSWPLLHYLLPCGRVEGAGE